MTKKAQTKTDETELSEEELAKVQGGNFSKIEFEVVTKPGDKNFSSSGTGNRESDL